MKKLKKLWPLFLSLAVLAVLIVIALSSSKVILFYGNTCSHCKKVEEYLQSNPSKVKYRFLEVYDNKENANLMISKAKLCGLNSDNVGIPFLYDGKKCLSGDQDIIDWFSKQ
ncbi:MAG: hypothetical protein NT165_03850 [Candidatus Falkowbacteria bacterium]|nr:hypothetical protein [Candidatus Falkowbacteria bacterium]